MTFRREPLVNFAMIEGEYIMERWMVHGLVALAFAIFFVISFMGEKRRYRNAIFLGGAIHFTMYTIIDFTLPDIPMEIVRMNVYTFGFMIVALAGAAILYVDTYKLVKREGPGRTAMLPGLVATIVLMLALGSFALVQFDERLFFLRIINITIIFILFFNAFVLMTFVVYTLIYSMLPVKTDFDYIIIHGAGLLEGHRVSKLLASRIDKAIEVYERCGKKAKLIPSGGKGSDEAISEAEAIEAYLIEKGVNPENIMLEDQSTSTRENLMFSKRLIEAAGPKEGYKCIFVTSNYHVMRTAVYAKLSGLRGECVGARTRMYYWISAFLREYAAILEANKYAVVLWVFVWWAWFIWENM